MKPSSNNFEIFSALFLSLIVGVYMVFYLALGFNLAFWCLIAVTTLILSFISPRSGLLSLTFLTLVFAKQFTLAPLIINQIEYKFYLLDIFLVAIYFRMALDWSAHRDLKLKVSDWWLILFFVWTVIIFCFSIAFGNVTMQAAFSSLKNYTFYPAIAFSIWYFFRDWQSWKQWSVFALVGAVSSLVFLAYGLISGQGLWTEITPLSTAGSRFLDFDHAFYLSLALVASLPFVVLYKRIKLEWLAWLLPLFLVGVIASLMRHLWLALLIYFVWLLFSLGQGRRDLKYWLTRYLAAVVLLASLGVFIFNTLPQSDIAQVASEQKGYLLARISSFFNDQDSSFAWRSTLWQSVWSDYLESPWQGLGLGQRVFIDMGAYKDYVELRNVHNSFLAILVQLGVVGFVLMAFFSLTTVFKLWLRSYQKSEEKIIRYSLTGIVLFCAIAFLFQPYLEANWFSIWWWMSLGWSKRLYEGTLG